MGADLTLPLAKPGDHVETPRGRIGIVLAITQGGRREIQYLDLDGGTVELRADLLRVRVVSRPRPWGTR